jgi:hypothetical protein
MLKDFFPSALTMRPNKLERLSLETLSSQVLEFEGKGLYHQLHGITNLKYKLLYFLTPNKKKIQRERH